MYHKQSAKPTMRTPVLFITDLEAPRFMKVSPLYVYGWVARAFPDK